MAKKKKPRPGHPRPPEPKISQTRAVTITPLRLRVLIRIGQLTVSKAWEGMSGDERVKYVMGEELWAHTSEVYSHFSQKWPVVDRAIVDLHKGGLVKKATNEAAVTLSKRGYEVYVALCQELAPAKIDTGPVTSEGAKVRKRMSQILRGEE